MRYADSLRVIRDARTPENRRVNTLVSSVGIMENEEYLASPDGPVCLECLEDMTTRELIEICGEELQKA